MVGPLGRNTRKRYQSKIRQIKRNLNKHTGEVGSRLSTSYEHDNGAGDQISTTKDQRHMRLFYQNPNGLGPNIYDSDNICAVKDLESLKVDVLGLSETNVNWNNPFVRDKWRQLVQSAWEKSKIITSSIKDGDKSSTYKPGGATMILRNKYASMVSSLGGDEMGRWVWATLGGGKNKVTIITCYCPCDNSDATSGSGT